jgi:hypothetical protein
MSLSGLPREMVTTNEREFLSGDLPLQHGPCGCRGQSVYPADLANPPMAEAAFAIRGAGGMAPLKGLRSSREIGRS